VLEGEIGVQWKKCKGALGRDEMGEEVLREQ